MAESHLEPKVDPPENPCGGVCDKIMKNMVLTLTILGESLLPPLPSTIHRFTSSAFPACD